MDDIDLDILKYMSDRDRYYEMKEFIDRSLCVKESWNLLQDMGAYFNQHPNIQELDTDFKLWQRVQRHPEWKSEQAGMYSKLVDRILSRQTPDRDTFIENMRHLKMAGLYRNISERMQRGTLSAEDAESELDTMRVTTPRTNDAIQPFSLQDLATQTAASPGYYWRLEDLNRSIGPIKQGDFIVVGKRPEVGGTSFMLSELTYMHEQAKGSTIVFNNEEERNKIQSRARSAALNVGYKDLITNANHWDNEFDLWRSGRDFDLYHDPTFSLSDIRRQLDAKEYSLIGINVLLKISGTGQKEDHDKLQKVAESLRQIASEYAPVVAITQADPTAEGMSYIPQDRLYKSKTALQGEADALIMIGTDDPIRDDVRYMYVAKNKMPPAPCTDSRYKHLKSKVDFDFETGRFTSTTFLGHSKP